MIQKSFFTPKRFLYLFGENQIPEVETEVITVKETAKKSASEALDKELFHQKSIDEILTIINGKIDEKTDPQIKKMEAWAKELKEGTNFLSPRPRGMERVKALFTDSEIKRAQQATRLDEMVTDLKQFAAEQKALHLANKERYEEDQKNIREIFKNNAQGVAFLQEIKTSLQDSFNNYVTKIKSGENKEEILNQLQATHGNIISNFHNASAALEAIRNSPVFFMNPQFEEFATELETQIAEMQPIIDKISQEYQETITKVEKEKNTSFRQKAANQDVHVEENTTETERENERSENPAEKTLTAEEKNNPNKIIKINIFGKNIDLIVSPQSKIEKTTREEIFQRIEKRVDLKPFITDQTKFEIDESGKISFHITKGSEIIKYIANADVVLRVTRDLDQQWRKKRGELQHQKVDLLNQIEKVFQADTSLTPEQKKIVNDFLERNNWNYPMLAFFDQINQKKNLDFKISEKYKTFASQIESINDQIEKNNVREAIDDDPQKTTQQKSEIIYDTMNVSSPGTYTLNYPKKGIEREYFRGEFHLEREKNPGTGALKKMNFYDKEGNKKNTYEYDEEGKVQKVTHFGENGREISRYIRQPDGEFSQEMIDEKGNPFSTFDREKAKDPQLTAEKYLDMLAKKLDTPEKLVIFFETFLEYTDDKNGDYWQTAVETVSRVEKGKMPEDCDGYAFLAKEILNRQGKNAFVLGIPQHALCVWAERRPDGRYNAHSLCTFGYDKNGNRYGIKPDPEKEKGYATLQEAINSILVKYRKEGKGVNQGINYEVTDYMEIDNIPKTGVKQSLNAPLEILTDPALAQKFKEIQAAEANGDYDGAEKIYQEMAAKFPDRKFIHAGLNRIYQLKIEQILAANGKNIHSINERTIKNDPKILELLKKQTAAGEIVLGKSSKVQDFNDLANAYTLIGEKEKARLTLEKGIEAHPHNGFLYINLMSYYANEKNPVKVEEVYTTMRAKCEDISENQLKLSALYFRLAGNTQKAAEIEKETAEKKLKE